MAPPSLRSRRRGLVAPSLSPDWMVAVMWRGFLDDALERGVLQTKAVYEFRDVALRDSPPSQDSSAQAI